MKLRNCYTAVINNGSISMWTGPNPSADDEALEKAVQAADQIRNVGGGTVYPVLVREILPDDTPMTLAGIPKRKGYVIHGSTGCSCCRSENFVEGVYEDVSKAIDRAKSHEDRRTVRSQYSSTGIYTVREVEYEKLPDGRVIIGSRVYESDSFMEFGEEISEAIRYEGQEVGSQGKSST